MRARRRKRWPRRLLIALVVIPLVLLGLVLGYFQLRASNLELPTPKLGESSTVYASDGQTVLGHIAASGAGYVSLREDQISPLLRQAHMAAEDRGFYTHGAISLPGMAWASLTNARKGALAAGGSTITQQYVKQAYLNGEKSLERKHDEILYSYRLESELTKDQILTKYLNINYYGRGATGIEDACQVWFGHSATELSDIHDPMDVAKAAFLALLVKNPSDYDDAAPGHPEQLDYLDKIIVRQEYVLDGLRDLEGVDQAAMVSAEVIAAAKALLPLQLTTTVKASGSTADGDPYLLDYVTDWLAAWQTQLAKLDETVSDEDAAKKGADAAEAMLARGGLSIYTSIDPRLQNLVAEAVRERLPAEDLSAGVVILDPRTGGVAAMYSGADYAKDGFNYALYANRPVGSTMKMVVLADAVRNGISVQSEFAAPAYIEVNGAQIWNHDKEAAPDCRLSLADAIAQSNNPVHVELITGQMASCDNPAALSPFEDGWPVSPASVAALAHQMGADDSLVPGMSSPSQLDEVPTLALGVSSMTPLKLASIGATLANDGVHTTPHLVQRIGMSDGSVMFEHQVKSERVLESEPVRIVNQTLTGVYTEGTARGAQVDRRKLAGKTGSLEADIWMVAYSAVDPEQQAPAYVCSAWAGYPDNRPVSAGSSNMAKICQYFFAGALEGAAAVNFPEADLNAGRTVGLNAPGQTSEPETTTELPPPPEPTSDPTEPPVTTEEPITTEPPSETPVVPTEPPPVVEPSQPEELPAETVITFG